MYKKIGMFFLASFLGLSLVGCNKKNEVQTGLSKESQEKTQEKMVVNDSEGAMEEGGIASLLASKAKIKCEYKIVQGTDDINVLTYIDGEKFKTESKVGGVQIISVFDGESYYNWTEGAVKQGTKMAKECIEEMKATNAGEVENKQFTFDNVAEIVAGENQMQMNCYKTAEIDWEIPTDINFMDSCKLMKNVENPTQNIEQIQKDMEKMQQDMGL